MAKGMACCERKRTAAQVLLLVFVAAATVSHSGAWPIRITRESPDTPVDNVNDAQMNLKRSISALTLIIDPFRPMGSACQLWENVTAAVHLQEEGNRNGSSNSTVSSLSDLRQITCHKISEEITDFDIIQGDGSCSETTLDYLCDRQLQKIESYSLFGMIDVDMVGFLDWLRENFDQSLADQIISLYRK